MSREETSEARRSELKENFNRNLSGSLRKTCGEKDFIMFAYCSYYDSITPLWQRNV